MSLLPEGFANSFLHEEEHEALLSVLARVHRESNSRAVLLIDTNGRLVVEVGDTAELDVTSFASLTASNIAATASMARLVGEKDFTILFHQGEKDSVHITLVDDRVILAVIFGKEASLGLVRLRVKRAAAEIKEIVWRLMARARVQDPLDLSRLVDITEQDIDEMFTF